MGRLVSADEGKRMAGRSLVRMSFQVLVSQFGGRIRRVGFGGVIRFGKGMKRCFGSRRRRGGLILRGGGKR